MKKLIIHSKKHGTHTVLYDNKDHKLISKYKWHIYKGWYNFYAHVNSGKRPNRTVIAMHRLIMKFPKEVDHKNGNGLDNRRCNLRTSINGGNQMNKGLQKNNKSGYKGVSFDKRSRRYISVISINHKRIYLGSFKKAIDGAIAYNKVVKKYHKGFARLNKL